MLINRYEEIKKCSRNAYALRLYGQLDYLLQLNNVNKGKFDSLLLGALKEIINFYNKEKTFTNAFVKKIESSLMSLQSEAQKYTVICIGHAHIDVNWQWGIDETVNITASTFETMLYLMDNYKDFTFMQSQGYLYVLMGKYRPDLIKRIKKYVKEGRWEVTASTYVENDNNMIDMLSSNLQFKYSKRQVAEIFDISDSTLDLDFEPDTFGHHRYRPEILVNNDIKYVYHCRGSFTTSIYKFVAPSGKEVLVFREPNWYLGFIEHDSFAYVPAFCSENGTNFALKVYGVGDHGGGCTVRDLNRLYDMQKWPLMPRIKFGTLHAFFKEIEKIPNIKQIDFEQNSVFTGCYSSVYEIKKQNAMVESNLKKALLWCALDDKHKYSFDEAFHAYLPTHFHDTITGSNVKSAIDFALGEYQIALSNIGAHKALALKTLSQKIDSTKIYSSAAVEFDNIAIGAAGGYLNKKNNFALSLGYGKERAFAIFNPSNFTREEIIDLDVWDYYGDVTKLIAYDASGKELPFALQQVHPFFYWYHNCHTVSVKVKVPALGYTTVLLKEKDKLTALTPDPNPRISLPKDDIVLDNGIVKAIFDKTSLNLNSLLLNGQELATNGRFELVVEDASESMTAWRIGRFKKITPLANFSVIPGSYFKNDVRQGFSYRTTFNNSEIFVHVSLDKGDASLKFNVGLRFYEIGSPEFGVPMLRYVVENSEKPAEAIYNVAGGFTKRPAKNQNQVALSLVSVGKLGIFGKGLHGYRYDKDSLSVTLIRNSLDPAVNPELGDHEFDFRLLLTSNLVKAHEVYTNELDHILLTYQKGPHPLEYTFISVDEKLQLHYLTDDEVVVTNHGPTEEFMVLNKKVHLEKDETKIIKR